MSRLLSNPITYVVGLLLLIALALFLLSMVYLRQARRGRYWRLRHAAGQRGGQLFLISMTLFGLAATVAFFSGFAAIAVEEVNQFLFGTPNPTIWLRRVGDDWTVLEDIPADRPSPFAQWVEHIRRGTRATENVANATDLSALVEAANRSAELGTPIEVASGNRGVPD